MRPDPFLPRPPTAVGGGPPRKVPAKPLDFLVLIFLPWLIFSLIVGLYAFAYQDFAPLVWGLVAASALLGLLFLAMGSASGKAAQVALGVLVVTAVGIALPVGMMLERRYTTAFWEVDYGASYRHVSPAAPASSFLDASVIAFEPGSAVDVQRSLGFMKFGDVFCAAPVYGSDMVPVATAPGFWAVGRNCCGQRGRFECGDVGIQGIVTGVVVREDRSEYETAVRMAEAAYELKGGTGPKIFVRWTANPLAYKAELWNRAMTTTTLSSGLYFVGSAGAALVLGRGLLR